MAKTWRRPNRAHAVTSNRSVSDLFACRWLRALDLNLRPYGNSSTSRGGDSKSRFNPVISRSKGFAGAVSLGPRAHGTRNPLKPKNWDGLTGGRGSPTIRTPCVLRKLLLQKLQVAVFMAYSSSPWPRHSHPRRASGRNWDWGSASKRAARVSEHLGGPAAISPWASRWERAGDMRRRRAAAR